MEAVIFHSSSDESQTVRTHKRILNRQASNFEAGILPSPPIINHSLSSYPPFSSHQKQPPLLPLPIPVPGPSLVRNSSINPLVRGLALPPINTKPNKKNIAASKSSIIAVAAAPRKSTSSSFLSTTFKPWKQTTAKHAATGADFSKQGGSRSAMCHVPGARSMKNPSKTEQASPKLLKEMDKVGHFWESVVFTLSPPPSSLPMPSFSILRPKLGCGY